MTIEPAITHGLAGHVGSLQPGRLADLVMWKPGFFGVKPEWVFKGGFPAWGPMGEGNASLERAEPTRYRAGLGRRAVGGAPGRGDVRVVVGGSFGAGRPAGHAADPRPDLAASAASPGPRCTRTARPPPVEIDVRTGAVTLGGLPLAVDPVTEVPLSRRYLLR